jgi:hypothetical protein
MPGLPRLIFDGTLVGVGRASTYACQNPSMVDGHDPSSLRGLLSYLPQPCHDSLALRHL